MSDRELAAIISNRVNDSLGLTGDKLSNDRITALQYYRGDPFGNEIDGRSQVVSRDVAEAVDGVLPGLMKIFLSSDQIVRYEPHGMEDEEAARQATDYVNTLVLQKNQTFVAFYNWFKDALLQKTGVIKVWWDDAPKITREPYRNLDEAQYLLIASDPDIEIGEESTETVMGPDGAPVTLHHVVVTRTNKQGRVCFEPVPPEEFFIERWATSLETALFCAHHFRRTVSDLIEDGFDAEKVRRAIGNDIGDFVGERANRFNDEDVMIPDDRGSLDDETTRYVWITECYLLVDYDGDGVAERRKVTVAGDSEYEILDNEEIDEYPFAAVTPILMPHKFHGMSIADQVTDIQQVKSTLMRQTLDNLYISNDPKRVVVEDKVNLDDLLSGGHIIRAQDVNAIREVEVPFVAAQSFQMMEYWDTIREQRTGITRYSQGLDANSLNKTATGINIIQSAAQQRQELIARVFAETGVKRLFRLILGLVTKYQNQKQTIRLRNKWVDMDPRTWKNDYDVSITVGLGTGTKQEQVGTLQMLAQMQQQIVNMQNGVQGPLVNLENVYNVLSKLTDAMGYKSAEPFFTDPKMAQQPPQQQPHPDQLKAQAEIERKNQQAEMDRQNKIKDAELQRQIDWDQANNKAAIDRYLAIVEAENRNMLAGTKAGAQIHATHVDTLRRDMQHASDMMRRQPPEVQ